jgi:hypothetical protein
MTWDWVLDTDSWEWASYVVTVFALPFGIAVFAHEQRRERQNEDEELYQRLSDEYAEFSKLLLVNTDLGLMTYPTKYRQLNEEQIERRNILFDILISLLERAYILVYDIKMNEQAARLWASWDDYIRFWCRRDDFREALPWLLEGEDPDFGAYIRKIAENPVSLQ